MKPKGGLLIDVIAGPSKDDDDEALDEVTEAPTAPASSTSPEALLDSIQTQLDQLRAQLAG